MRIKFDNHGFLKFVNIFINDKYNFSISIQTKHVYSWKRCLIIWLTKFNFVKYPYEKQLFEWKLIK